MTFDRETVLAMLLWKGVKRTPLVGFALGTLCGPIGVGVFLWSITDFILSFALCTALGAWDCPYYVVVGWICCGIWNVVRMKRNPSEEKPIASSRPGSPTAVHS
ncbi:hypothetical protein J4558_04145 [Leptolyngbya sp. 15MV]|nr:hypothetical protein J4558_04145 [Leptolyngbya sp. 15MV]